MTDLIKLAKKWRTQGLLRLDGGPPLSNDTLRYCADALEKALAAPASHPVTDATACRSLFAFYKAMGKPQHRFGRVKIEAMKAALGVKHDA